MRTVIDYSRRRHPLYQSVMSTVQRTLLDIVITSWKGIGETPCAPYIPAAYHEGFNAGKRGDVRLRCNPYTKCWEFYSFFTGWTDSRLATDNHRLQSKEIGDGDCSLTSRHCNR